MDLSTNVMLQTCLDTLISFLLITHIYAQFHAQIIVHFTFMIMLATHISFINLKHFIRSFPQHKSHSSYLNLIIL
jgi:hypothetical protein